MSQTLITRLAREVIRTNRFLIGLLIEALAQFLLFFSGVEVKEKDESESGPHLGLTLAPWVLCPH